MTEKKTESKRRYWRSLDELQRKPEFEQFLQREFPVAASEFPQGVSRRRWLQLMGASLAMGGAIGCRYPEETIAPFVVRPEGRIPGELYVRATNFELADRVHHLLVTCVDGRPLKIEGNADHPSSGGGTDHYVQASILGLYDPDRMSGVTHTENGKRHESDWDQFDAYASSLLANLQQLGERMAILMPPTRSPSTVRLVERLREAGPETTLCVYDSVHADVIAEATEMATGQVARPSVELHQARVIFSLDADLLGQHPNFVRNARAYAAGRNPDDGEMSRMYVVESGFSTTGMAADSRLPLRPSQMPAFLAALERKIDGLDAGDRLPREADEVPYDQLEPQEKLERFLDVLAEDLVAARGESIVAVGEHLGPEAVAAGIRLNHKLNNLGRTLRFIPPVRPAGETVGLPELVDRMGVGEFDAVLILGGNPVFNAPADVPLGEAISRVTHSIYLGEYDDETAVLCRWALPAAHPLESWGDCIGDDGIYGVCQPHILPLLGGRTAAEVITRMLREDEIEAESIVRRTAESIANESLSDRRWRQLLHDGFLAEVGLQTLDLTSNGGDDPLTEATPVATRDVNFNDLELVFVPAEGLYDGRFANNGWLQEMPQSLTKLTWDNAAIMSPLTARAIGVQHGTMVALGEPRLELPVFEIPGMAPGVVTIAFGYGRTRAGAVGGHVELDVAPVGFDISPLRTSDAMLVAIGVEGRPRRDTYELATTQNHWAIDELGREEAEDRSHRLVREGSFELYKLLPEFAQHLAPHVPDGASLWREPMNEIEKEVPTLPQWGMSIDLTKCVGCNACVIACQAENNVPIVGKQQVAMGREMHWLRIDRYFQGDEEHTDVVQEPLACVHCETAPCESVCPVAATAHTDDGINAMAYNRCIGTRYCANNCPYKVRRFNYFNWNQDVGVGYGFDGYPEDIENANRKLQQLVLNPEVTVRGRGVMEKCTYCIQRVERAKIEARNDGGRPIRDGDVETACQSACPTGAIQFGNLSDPHSRVAELRSDPRTYAMLEQINTQPRTTYMARISNPHPRLMTADQLVDLKRLPEKASHHDAGHGGGTHEEHVDDEPHGAGEHGEHSSLQGSAQQHRA